MALFLFGPPLASAAYRKAARSTASNTVTSQRRSPGSTRIASINPRSAPVFAIDVAGSANSLLSHQLAVLLQTYPGKMRELDSANSGASAVLRSTLETEMN